MHAITHRPRRVAAALLAAGALFTTAASAIAADAYTVPMQGSAFLPDQQTVPVGTTVTWVNQDAEEHDVLSDDGAISSPTIPPGQSWSFAFTRPGTFHYVCDLHENMAATIVVTAG